MEDAMSIIMMGAVGFLVIALYAYIAFGCLIRKAKKQGNEDEVDKISRQKKFMGKFMVVSFLITVIAVVIITLSKGSSAPPYDFSDGISEEEGEYIKDMNDWYSEEYGE